MHYPILRCRGTFILYSFFYYFKILSHMLILNARIWTTPTGTILLKYVLNQSITNTKCRGESWRIKHKFSLESIWVQIIWWPNKYKHTNYIHGIIHYIQVFQAINFQIFSTCFLIIRFVELLKKLIKVKQKFSGYE